MRVAVVRRLPSILFAGIAPGRRRSPTADRPSWFRRWTRRPEPTVYHRCLAVHIYYAAPRSALS